jgi:hypothetical protein
MKKISVILAIASLLITSNTWANAAAVMMMQKQMNDAREQEAKTKELRAEQYRSDSATIPVRWKIRTQIAKRLAEEFPSDAVLYRVSQLDSVYDGSGECSRIIVNMFYIAALKGSESKRLEAIFPLEALGKSSRCTNPVTLKNVLKKQQEEFSTKNLKAPSDKTTAQPIKTAN